MLNTELNLSTKRTKELLNRAVKDSIRRLNEKDFKPMSFSLEGKPGISKTSIANSLTNMIEFHSGKKANIYNLRPAERGVDINSIMGFPYEEFLTKDGWLRKENILNKEVLDSRLKYSPPHWLKILEETEYSVLVLDDINRGHSSIYNALMGLLEDKGFADWVLPKGCFVISTLNNDDESQVEVVADKAQSGRVISININSIDIMDWYDSFGKNHLTSCFTDFIISFWSELSEVLDNDIRSLTKFGIQIDYLLEEYLNTGHKNKAEKKSLLTLIAYLGKATVGNKVTQLFIDHYLNNLVNEIPNFRDLMFKETPERFINIIKDCFNKNPDKKLTLNNIIYLRLFSLHDMLTSENIDYFIKIINSEALNEFSTTREYWNNKVLTDNKYKIIRTNPLITNFLKSKRILLNLQGFFGGC